LRLNPVLIEATPVPGSIPAIPPIMAAPHLCRQKRFVENIAALLIRHACPGLATAWIAALEMRVIVFYPTTTSRNRPGTHCSEDVVNLPLHSFHELGQKVKICFTTKCSGRR
jgi:hypothetical protein